MYKDLWQKPKLWNFRMKVIIGLFFFNHYKKFNSIWIKLRIPFIPFKLSWNCGNSWFLSKFKCPTQSAKSWEPLCYLSMIDEIFSMDVQLTFALRQTLRVKAWCEWTTFAHLTPLKKQGLAFKNLFRKRSASQNYNSNWK